MSQTRRLAAVLAAFAAEEEGTLARQKALANPFLAREDYSSWRCGGGLVRRIIGARLTLLGRFLFCRTGRRADGFGLTGSGFAGIFLRHGHGLSLKLIKPSPFDNSDVLTISI